PRPPADSVGLLLTVTWRLSRSSAGHFLCGVGQNEAVHPGVELEGLLVELAAGVAPPQVDRSRAREGSEAEVDLEAAVAAVAATTVELGDLGAAGRGGHRGGGVVGRSPDVGKAGAGTGPGRRAVQPQVDVAALAGGGIGVEGRRAPLSGHREVERTGPGGVGHRHTTGRGGYRGAELG